MNRKKIRNLRSILDLDDSTDLLQIIEKTETKVKRATPKKEDLIPNKRKFIKAPKYVLPSVDKNGPNNFIKYLETNSLKFKPMTPVDKFHSKTHGQFPSPRLADNELVRPMTMTNNLKKKKTDILSFYDNKEYKCKYIFATGIKTMKREEQQSLFERYYSPLKKETSEKTKSQNEKINIFLKNYKAEKKAEKELQKEVEDKVETEQIDNLIFRDKIRNFMKHNYENLSYFGDATLDNPQFFSKKENKVNFKDDINLTPSMQNNLVLVNERIAKNNNNNDFNRTSSIMARKDQKKLREVNNPKNISRRLSEFFSELKVKHQETKDRSDISNGKFSSSIYDEEIDTKNYQNYLLQLDMDSKKKKDELDCFDYLTTRVNSYNEVDLAQGRVKDLVIKIKTGKFNYFVQKFFKKFVMDNVKSCDQRFSFIVEELKISENIKNIAKISQQNN